MIIKYTLMTILVFVYCLTSKSQNNNKSTNEITGGAISPIGRFIKHEDKKLELISSGVHFGFSFEGTQIQLFVTIPDQEGHNYLQYELDDVYQKRIKISGNTREPILITAKTNGRHIIWIYKATEAHTGPIFFHKAIASNIKTINKPSAPIIEFIGNSITCGAAADPSEVPCNTGQYHDQHNAYMAYGPRVARKQKVNFVLSSVSGIGIYRNWNSDGPAMPQVYKNADFQENSSRQWDFSKFTPQIISIALGTNDFSNGDGIKKRLPFDSATYVENHISFIAHVRNKYPKALVALLSSPMIKGDARIKLQNCLTAVKSVVDKSNPTGNPLELFFFESMDARGCSGHPNVEDHEIMASQLNPFFDKLLKQIK